MATFLQLQTDVKNWLLDLPTETEASVPDFINKVIRDAQERSHNFTFMQQTAQLTTSGVRALGAKPALWKARRGDPYLVYDDGTTREVAWAPSESEMLRRYDDDVESDGRPEFILERPEDFSVYPLPDGDSDWPDGEYRVYLPYFAYTAALSADGDTNWMTNNMRWYIIFAAAGEGFLMNRDPGQAQTMFAKAENEYRRAISQEKRARLSPRMSLTPRRAQFGPARGIRR